MKMKKPILLLFTLTALFSGCMVTPDKVTYNGKMVGTFSAAAGCKKLGLDEDCSAMTGSTRAIKIDGIELRIAGGNGGKTVFVMSKPKMVPNEEALTEAGPILEKYWMEQGIEVLETRVMYSSNTLFGVYFLLSEDGYTFLKAFTQ